MDPLTPLYHQIKSDLTAAIREGRLRAGDFLPSERELQQRYGVSRATVREAVARMAHEGLVVRVRGRGMRVLGQPIRHELFHLASFTEVLRHQGFEPGIRDIEVHRTPAPPEVAERLGLAPGTRLLRVARVRTANGEPVCRQESFIIPEAAEAVSEAQLAAVQSLYRLLELHRFPVVRTEDELYACSIPAEEAGFLGVAPGSPVLVLERTAYLADGRPVEYARSLMRSQLYRYLVVLQRRQPDARDPVFAAAAEAVPVGRREP